MNKAVEKTSTKILETVLTRLERGYKDHTDAEMTAVLGVLIGSLTQRIVLDSLSIRQEQYETMQRQELMALVNQKFLDMRLMVETVVTEAFEVAVKEGSNKNIEYTCRIAPAPKAVNGLPC